jgi:hypothetical protein
MNGTLHPVAHCDKPTAVSPDVNDDLSEDPSLDVLARANGAGASADHAIQL